MKTVREQCFIVAAYSPLEPFFTKTWRPSEIEPVKP